MNSVTEEVNKRFKEKNMLESMSELDKRLYTLGQYDIKLFTELINADWKGYSAIPMRRFGNEGIEFVFPEAECDHTLKGTFERSSRIANLFNDMYGTRGVLIATSQDIWEDDQKENQDKFIHIHLEKRKIIDNSLGLVYRFEYPSRRYQDHKYLGPRPLKNINSVSSFNAFPHKYDKTL